jgi:NAD(P)-dependent dehydrogenase (short-subunit alcohol dehydrogenase family)
VPAVLKRRGGSIVNLGSSVAVNGDASFASYAMAKEAIRGLTRVAAREWGPFGIRVNVICPAATSPASATYAETHPAESAAFIGATALGRRGDPELDIGRAVVALVSDDFRYFTGSTVMLEGGRIFLT